jgi:hypothetical protein
MISYWRKVWKGSEYSITTIFAHSIVNDDGNLKKCDSKLAYVPQINLSMVVLLNILGSVNEDAEMVYN